MITQDLGIATAYGYAKSKGYTGTEAEFAELMASYASTAQTAIEAADRAVEANTAAQSAKISAQSSASAASTAAQTAISKASEAVAAAGTATTKASEASQSATSASQSAESAGTSAQTATMAASTATAKASKASESAATASTAKTDAETARDAAAQSASEAAASAESIDPDEFDRKIYAAFATDIATGAIASFPDGADSIPMKDVLVHIEPVQAGSGDPSPENVRPITGWTGAKVTRTGVNVLNPSLYSFQTKTQNGLTYTVQQDGTVKVTGTATATGGPSLATYFKLKPGTYCYRDENSQHVRCAYRRTLTPGSSSTALANPFTTDGTDYIYVNMFCDATGTYDLVIHPQISVGSILSDFTPYTGEAISVSFGQTVYGGTLDVTTGELVVDRAIIASYNGETLPSTWISDRDVYSEGATPTTGAQVCYELATPITYQLTLQEITSLLGENNIWADTGDSDVEYRADTKLYITKKITEAVSALS